MAGKGMGAATKGGGCIEGGARNRMMSTTSKKAGDPIMMATGGAVNAHKKMAMKGVKKMNKGGMCK